MVPLVRSGSHPLTSLSLANAAEEFFVRQSPLYEVVGQLGMWGTLINITQAAALEHKDMWTATWNGAIGEFRSVLSQSHGLTACLKLVC